MLSETVIVLHVGYGQEVTILEYLYRVVLYLVAFGVIALLVYWGMNAIETIRPRV